MRSSSTNSIATCPSAIPADDSASEHSSSISATVGSAGAIDSIPMTSTSSISGSGSFARPEIGRLPLGVLVIGGDDPLHELVPDDVLATEADELDPLDAVEHIGDDHQPGVVLAGQ